MMLLRAVAQWATDDVFVDPLVSSRGVLRCPVSSQVSFRCSATIRSTLFSWFEATLNKGLADRPLVQCRSIAR